MTASYEFETSALAPWEAPFWEAQDAFNRRSLEPGAQVHSPDTDPAPGAAPIRPRLHVLCALYAHSPELDQRLSLLEGLEELVQQRARALAIELLEGGWRPDVRTAA